MVREGECPPAGDDLRHPRGGLLRRARADGDPEQQPPPHRPGGMEPRSLTRTPCGMRLIPLDTGHIYRAHHLAMMGRSPLGHDTLQAMHGCEIPGTCRRSLHHRRPTADLTAAVRPCLRGACCRPSGGPPVSSTPGRIRDSAAVPCASASRSTTEARGYLRRDDCSVRIVDAGTRIASALWRWRRGYHSGHPVRGIGPKDIDSAPVLPCYCSPGLPRIRGPSRAARQACAMALRNAQGQREKYLTLELASTRNPVEDLCISVSNFQSAKIGDEYNF